MNWITEAQVKEFIKKHNYDIRKNAKKIGSARWIDQKCTPDVLCIIADCIIEFSEISGYIENIIALTPSQHFGEAHPNGNTRNIDKSFQQLCLLSKANHIKSNILEEKEVIYSFNNFIFVLTIGLDDNRFNEIDDMDFDEVVRVINMDYVCV